MIVDLGNLFQVLPSGPVSAGVEEQRAIVRRSVGQSGPNPEYVLSTLAHLREMGIRDENLEAVAAGL